MTREEAIEWINEQSDGSPDSDDLDEALRALGCDPDVLRGDNEDPIDRRWDVACAVTATPSKKKIRNRPYPPCT